MSKYKEWTKLRKAMHEARQKVNSATDATRNQESPEWLTELQEKRHQAETAYEDFMSKYCGTVQKAVDVLRSLSNVHGVHSFGNHLVVVIDDPDDRDEVTTRILNQRDLSHIAHDWTPHLLRNR